MLRAYDMREAKAYCGERGLQWDPESANAALGLARRHDMTNDALNDAIKLHTDVVVRGLTPARFSWPSRIIIAAYMATLWLGIISPPGAK